MRSVRYIIYRFLWVESCLKEKAAFCCALSLHNTNTTQHSTGFQFQNESKTISSFRYTTYVRTDGHNLPVLLYYIHFVRRTCTNQVYSSVAHPNSSFYDNPECSNA
jgi:hypothetical protein